MSKKNLGIKIFSVVVMIMPVVRLLLGICGYGACKMFEFTRNDFAYMVCDIGGLMVFVAVATHFVNTILDLVNIVLSSIAFRAAGRDNRPKAFWVTSIVVSSVHLALVVLLIVLIIVLLVCGFSLIAYISQRV